MPTLLPAALTLLTLAAPPPDSVDQVISTLDRQLDTEREAQILDHARQYLASLTTGDFDAYEQACAEIGLALIPALEEPGALRRSGFPFRVADDAHTRDFLREQWGTAAKRTESFEPDAAIAIDGAPNKLAELPAEIANRNMARRGVSSFFIDPDGALDRAFEKAESKDDLPRVTLYVPVQTDQGPAIIQLEYLWIDELARWVPFRVTSAAELGEPLHLIW